MLLVDGPRLMPPAVLPAVPLLTQAQVGITAAQEMLRRGQDQLHVHVQAVLLRIVAPATHVTFLFPRHIHAAQLIRSPNDRARQAAGAVWVQMINEFHEPSTSPPRQQIVNKAALLIRSPNDRARQGQAQLAAGIAGVEVIGLHAP